MSFLKLILFLIKTSFLLMKKVKEFFSRIINQVKHLKDFYYTKISRFESHSKWSLKEHMYAMDMRDFFSFSFDDDDFSLKVEYTYSSVVINAFIAILIKLKERKREAKNARQCYKHYFLQNAISICTQRYKKWKCV